MTDFTTDFTDEEYQDMGSLNHSLTQAQLVRSLPNDKFTITVELSLDISQIDTKQFGLKAKEELKPDVCLYPNSVVFSKPRDILRMSNMPLLSIEILSPTQSVEELLAKIQAYFALGIKSCWLVIPAFTSVIVYASGSPDDFKNFDKRDAEVVDEVLDIRVPLQKIFPSAV
jgi:Uma2 family endonuclease